MKATVGEQLRSARESKGLTLEDAVKATNIRRAYLQELENDHPEALHSAAQARGFLRLYASYLGIPAAQLIAMWDEPALAEPSSTEPADPSEERFAQDDVGRDVEITPPAEADQADEVTTAHGQDEKTSIREILQRIPKLSQFFLKKKTSREKTADGFEKEQEQVPQPEEAVQAAPAARAAKEIMADIGKALRERRDALELTLSDAETFTSVKRIYLEAMENGQFDALPSTVQGRGMLTNYARFLALDETWVMDAYAKSLLAVRSEREAGSPKKARPLLTVRLNIPEKWRRILNPDLIIGGLFIIGLFTFIIWGGAQVFSASEPTATEAPSISEMLVQTPSIMNAATEEIATDEAAPPQATAIPGVANAEVTPTVIATVNTAPLQLYIIISDRAYLEVNVDGEAAYTGRVEPDDVFTFSGQEEITLLSGNGAAIEAYFNQEFIGELGRVGEVVDIIFSLDGLLTSTPAPTETPPSEAGPAGPDAMDAMEDDG